MLQQAAEAWNVKGRMMKVKKVKEFLDKIRKRGVSRKILYHGCNHFTERAVRLSPRHL
jgi:hypothetical protein